MMFYAQMSSGLGRILLCSKGDRLNGLYFVGQKDCPPLAGLPPPLPQAGDPTSGLMSGVAIKNLKAHKQPELDLFGPGDFAGTTPGADGIAAPDEALSAAIDCSPDSLSYMQAVTPDNARAVFEQTQEELYEYFHGQRTTFTVPLETEGTDFQKKVWRALQDIPYGEFVSYGDVARAAGLTAQHGRPVGTAVGRNPVTIIIPCHRVLSSAGTLAGYTGGLERKFALLELEGFSLS